ncbi:MAG: hypothetical protein ACYC64_18915 [Armatimonadota bacterium]
MTAGTGVFKNNVIYVEDESRTAGIGVISSPSPPAVTEGDRVSVEGRLTIVDGQRMIVATKITGS